MENNNQNPFSNFKKVTLDPAKKLAMKSELVNFVKQNPISINNDPTHLKVRTPFFSFVHHSQRAFAALVIFAGVLGVVQVSEGTKPGDLLYPVRIYLADPINELFKSGGGETVSEDINLLESFNATGDDSFSDTEVGDTMRALEFDDSTKNSAPAEFNTMMSESVQSDTRVDTEPTSLKTNSNLVLPSVGITAASVVLDSGRIKVLFPDRYTVAKTGDIVRIRWENNLLRTDDGKQNTVSMHLSSVTFLPGAIPAVSIVLADNILSSVESSHEWRVPKDLPPGYYKIMIIPLGEVAMSGSSEQFAVVEE